MSIFWSLYGTLFTYDVIIGEDWATSYKSIRRFFILLFQNKKLKTSQAQSCISFKCSIKAFLYLIFILREPYPTPLPTHIHTITS